jgi:hypothetical protein
MGRAGSERPTTDRWLAIGRRIGSIFLWIIPEPAILQDVANSCKMVGLGAPAFRGTQGQGHPQTDTFCPFFFNLLYQPNI